MSVLTCKELIFQRWSIFKLVDAGEVGDQIWENLEIVTFLYFFKENWEILRISLGKLWKIFEDTTGLDLGNKCFHFQHILNSHNRNVTNFTIGNSNVPTRAHISLQKHRVTTLRESTQSGGPPTYHHHHHHHQPQY